MLLDVVIEKRFYRTPDDKIWTDNAFPYAFWRRYLNVFSAVNIVARVHDVDAKQDNWQAVLGPDVMLTALPGYVGPWQFFKQLPATMVVLRSRKNQSRKVLYRVPGILAWLYQLVAGPKAGMYAAEVVGDPADTFAAGASKSPLRPFIRSLFIALLRHQCRNAGAISYVTQFALQRRYPPGKSAFHTYYSSIQLSQDDYRQVTEYQCSTPTKLLCIGNLEQPYKGCDVMLEALRLLLDAGENVQLTWVGGGRLQAQMEQLAVQLGVAKAVEFVGNVAQRSEIRRYLDNCDVFVLSSRQEGLPRVVIEAMARSKLCVATDVGGVGELLSAHHIVTPGDAQMLARTITDVVNTDEQKQLMIAQGHYQKALEYSDETLSERRMQMYNHLASEVA